MSEDPEKIDRYQIRKVLGHGGMATVYYAYDPRVGREVAVKVLLKELTDDPMFRQRFEREVQSVVALEHSAIVPIYDYGEAHGQPFLVMRYMQGGTLADRLRDGKLKLDQAAAIMARVGAALDQAHAHGIIHRDLKPGNILFDQYDNAFLSDFGIVKIDTVGNTTTLSDAGGVVGTPAYMSPEQVQGDADIDRRTDIYALGVILYECLTGTIPFNANTPLGMAIKHVTEPVPRLLDVSPNLPQEVSDLLEKALAKDRKDRFSTVGELVTELLKVTGADLKALMQSGSLIPAGMPPPAVPGDKPDNRPVPITADLDVKNARVPGSDTEPSRFNIGLGKIRISIPLWALIGGGAALLVALGLIGLIGVIARAGGGRQASGTPGLTPAAVVGAGARILFVSQESGKPTLFTMNPDGSDQKRLLVDNNTSTAAAWSPDGSKIAYTAQAAGGKRQIILMNADGSNLQTLTDTDSDNFSPSFSPDGKQIVFVSKRDGNAEIYSMNTDGSGQKRLTDSPANDLSPSFSPDGSLIVFDSAREGNAEIYIMRPDGSNPVPLTDNKAADYGATFSPDGKKIAFVSERDGNPEVYVMDSDGTDQTRLTRNDSADLSPEWSKDGKKIVFVARRDGNSEIYVMDADGGNPTRLTNNDSDDFDPVWQP